MAPPAPPGGLCRPEPARAEHTRPTPTSRKRTRSRSTKSGSHSSRERCPPPAKSVTSPPWKTRRSSPMKGPFRMWSILAQYVADAVHPGAAHRPQQPGAAAGRRQLSRRSAGPRIPGEKRPGPDKGFRRRPDPLQKGGPTMIFLDHRLPSPLPDHRRPADACLSSVRSKEDHRPPVPALSPAEVSGSVVTSCIYFVCLLTGLTGFTAAIDLLACLVFGSILFMQHRKRRLRKGPDLPLESQLSGHQAGLPDQGDRGKKPGPSAALPARTGSPLQILTIAIFSIALVSSLISLAVAFLKEPHGRWDAWLIWNMHARFLFRGGDHWRDAFASGLDWSHWDYPLLLPLSIARGWTYAGGEMHSSPGGHGLSLHLPPPRSPADLPLSPAGRHPGLSWRHDPAGDPLFHLHGDLPICRYPPGLFHPDDARHAVFAGRIARQSSRRRSSSPGSPRDCAPGQKTKVCFFS